MNKEDFENFQASFEHIDDILKVLVDELMQQLKDDHMSYDIEWNNELLTLLDSNATNAEKYAFIYLLIKDALLVSLDNAIEQQVVSDPWSRIECFMALRQSKEEVQSPISATEYEEIKVTAEKAKALDLESVHVNNERPEWTQEQQEALIMKKEEDESIKMATKEDKI